MASGDSQPPIYGGRYRSRSEELDGGTGTVVICDDPNLDRVVAIKFLHAQVPKRRIFDEIHALQRIRSKHVVQIYDVVIEPPANQIGVVQEYITGHDLRSLTHEAMTVDEALLLLYQVSSGLADIHRENLIHRDVKPNNIKRDDEGIIKIFDFDLARTKGGEAQTVGFRGTIGYAAPELFAVGAVVFTQAIDVYAFGATALFCIEGDLPPELTQIPPQPELWKAKGGFSSLRVKLPPAIAGLLDDCLSTSPTARPPIETVRAAVAKHLLENRHRALLLVNNKPMVLDAASRFVKVTMAQVGNISLSYDGLRFVVTAVQGDVSINNKQAVSGSLVHGCSVITLGAPALGTARNFVTLDVAHPEVVL